MIILNPFAFPKPPVVKMTKEVRKQLKGDPTILPEAEARDVERMRKFQEEANLMKVGLMPKNLAEKIVEEVKKIEAPTMKIEEKVEEKVEEPPKNKKERKQRAMKEGKDKKVKIEKLEKEIEHVKEEAKKEVAKAKEKAKEELAEEIEEKIEEKIRKPRGLREKLFPEIEVNETMKLLDIYKKLKGVKFEEDVDLRSLRPNKKLDYEKYIAIIKSKKPKNIKFD